MKPILYVDMDGVLCDIVSAMKHERVRYPHIPFPQSMPGFFMNMKPLPGALAAMRALWDEGYWSPWILTAPSIKNPLCYTEKRLWIERYIGLRQVRQMVICPDKSLLKGVALIDDNKEGAGQDRFEGELIHFGSPNTPGWAETMTALRRLTRPK